MLFYDLPVVLGNKDHFYIYTGLFPIAYNIYSRLTCETGVRIKDMIKKWSLYIPICLENILINNAILNRALGIIYKNDKTNFLL